MGRRVVGTCLFALGAVASATLLWPGAELEPLAAPRTDSAARAAASAATAAPDASRVDVAQPVAAARLRVDDPAAPAEAIAAPTAAERERFGAFVRDLANDHVRGNAGRAMRALACREAVPLLHETLRSHDAQQRQLAAALLMRLDEPTTPPFAAVLVELLDPATVRELYRTLSSSSAVLAARHLYRHPANARPALRRALWGREPQSRFLAAFLLGCDGSTADAAAIQTELVPHLEDNVIGGDALMAAHALFRLGHASRDALAAWRPTVDLQARSLIELILLDLDRPPRTREELVARSRLHRISRVYHDPVLEFDVGRSSLAGH